MSDDVRIHLAFQYGTQWFIWQPFPWRQRFATWLRGGGWHDGEWVRHTT